jgi:SAM-dependent methyltransferase
MAVLDVGAGTGSITAGIARAVGPAGTVLGIDRDETMIRRAREHHAGVANLAFELLDVLELRDDARFDVVTAARALQWIADPARALRRMHAATRPGGMAVVLEYTHADLVWDPAPPEPVRRFYDAFLAWRDANGWDNRLGDHLPGLLADAGFRDVVVTVEDEVATRGEAGFADALEVWQRVMETMGTTIVGAGFLGQTDLDAAQAAHRAWSEHDGRLQRMVLRAVDGRRAA